ncbi:MAG: peptidylprolyl isomerase [Bacteroidales bacterium]|nr:peptidylprolyl isomerase [Bacteroidales bacterium]MBN2818747.1 peptidylprolyl isomerase [Bacteroidales bacterium]
MKKITTFLTIALFSVSIFSQDAEDILMTIDGNEISSEEFLRVYNKNNGITLDSEKKSIDDYLDLFINYKLKVIEAENLGYDTLKSFIDEFGGYRDQLAKPYLQDTELNENLIKEAYERSKYEVEVSHILVKIGPRAAPEDTLKKYEKISAIRARVMAGEPFDEVAMSVTDDPSAKDNNGYLGFFSVFRMVYPFESVAFNTKVGEVSEPFRTSFGYHILKVHQKRETRGPILAAHIMTRIPKGASEPEIEAAKEKIEKARMELMNGADWKELVQKYSENPRTKADSGTIGWVTSNNAPAEFMEALYKLDKGQFGNIIKTEGGFHIPKVIEKKGLETLEEAYDKISKKVDNDNERRAALKDQMDSELKLKYGFESMDADLAPLAEVLDSGIYKKQWDVKKASGLNTPLFKIADRTYTLYNYAEYLASVSKFKFMHKQLHAIPSLEYKEYVSYCIDEYAKEQLPLENPEYKYLVQEYHDGILLFNLTNDKVWKRAQEDTLGLEEFYKTAEKYKWNDRIRTGIYEYSQNQFTSALPKIAKKQAKKGLDNDYVLQELCPNDTVPCITITEKVYEKGHDAICDKLTWKIGAYTVLNNENDNYFYYVRDILPSSDKKLNEARGLYISDYQTKLENEWVESLREKYNIVINTDVLESLKSKLNE